MQGGTKTRPSRKINYYNYYLAQRSFIRFSIDYNKKVKLQFGKLKC